MCCDGWDLENDEVADGICPECGAATLDGVAISGCNYSPRICDTCEDAPCDGSC